ncbi:MAG TPA: hypothetical protein DCQ52_06995 [Acidimicrobiaceae bacterium]|nr:hypothetical protein [Acidimicrobiaceae bacterium]
MAPLANCAALKSSMAWAATCCTSARRVSCTLPVLSAPPNTLSTFCCVVSPISTSFCVFSSWVLPKLYV